MRRPAKNVKHLGYPCILTSDSFQYIETYNSLRTNIRFASVDKPFQKILITSSIPGEGKSTVAINLAASLAGSGSRVLLADCDLRKPFLHKYLQIGSSTPGLTAAITGIADLSDCIFHLVEMNIDYLSSGPIPPNPTELLGSNRMGQIAEELSARYDYILFDTPPASVVTDAAVLSKRTDGYIFVIRHRSTTFEAARLAKHSLDNVGAIPVGAVLNQFSAGRSTGGYAVFQSKQYKAYYTYSSR